MKGILFVAVAGLFLLSACDDAGNTSVTSPDSPNVSTQAPDAPVVDSAKLNGSWVLAQITGIPGRFDSLYANKTPQMNFDVNARTVSGNTGCNNFSGELDIVGARISFVKPMVMTKMFCQGDAEPVFLQNLQKVTGYRIINDTALSFVADDIEVMRFTRKQ